MISEMKPPIKILCVDDNPMIGEAVEIKLQPHTELELIGQVMSASELLEQVETLQPDILLLDIDMPGKDAFEAMQEIAASFPEPDGPRIIILSGLIRRDLIDKAFESGAWGYLSKSDVEILAEAIGQVIAGEIAISPDVRSLMG